MKGDNLYRDALKEASKDDPDIENVLKLLTLAIKKGNASASYAMATWYLHGKFVTKNLKKAIDFFKIASEQNLSSALFDLAVCYEIGVGVKRNFKKSFELYLRAALAGDKQANYEVGRCYYYGIGINKNQPIGNIWLDKAKSLGIE